MTPLRGLDLTTDNQTHTIPTYLETNVSAQTKVVCIKPIVLQKLGIVQIVWVISRHGEVTETHHLLAGVGNQ